MSNAIDPTQQGSATPNRNRGWIKFVALGCFGLVLIGGMIVAGFVWTLQKATAGPEEAIQRFLAAAAAGDYAAAHDYFSAPLKQVQPYEQFAEAAAANSSFFAVKATNFSNRSVDMNGAEFSGNVTLESGTKVPAQFTLVRENDAWKIISYNLGS